MADHPILTLNESPLAEIQTPAAPPEPQVLQVSGQAGAQVRIFGSACLKPGPAEIAALQQVAGLPGVSVVASLPELHLKPRLEAPSSLAVAVRDRLVLGLSSPSPNCGMAMALLPLTQGDLSAESLDQFFYTLGRRLTARRAQPLLSPEGLLEVLLEGAAAAVRLLDLDPAVLSHIDEGGQAVTRQFSSHADKLEQVRRAIPAALLEPARRGFGQIGGGNHFLEIQSVEQIANPSIAAAWGVQPGQLACLYHADSGYLGAFVGRLYAHRRKNTARGRLQELRLKLPFQLMEGSPSHLARRLAYHVLPRRFVGLPTSSEEAARALLALQCAANYAYANRLAVLAGLREVLSEVYGSHLPAPTLLWDAPHNSIRLEEVDGERLWVHRHNAARVVPPSREPAGSVFAQSGHPVLLPGDERTCTYLASAGEGASASLHSADHGAGVSARRLGLPQAGATVTRVYNAAGFLGSRSHFTLTGAQAVCDTLQAFDIARPVAVLRPQAVWKGSI